jgi:hypothetical protein
MDDGRDDYRWKWVSIFSKATLKYIPAHMVTNHSRYSMRPLASETMPGPGQTGHEMRDKQKVSAKTMVNDEMHEERRQSK